MSTLPDWDTLASDWLEPEPRASVELSTIRAALRRRLLGTTLVVLAELALTAMLIVWTVREGATIVQRGDGLLVMVWGAWLLATLFAWWNRRGQWRVAVESVEDFAALSTERCRRQIAVARFTWGALAIYFGWIVIRALSGRSMATSTLTLWGLVAAAYLVWSMWYYRRARRLLRQYQEVSTSS